MMARLVIGFRVVCICEGRRVSKQGGSVSGGFIG